MDNVTCITKISTAKGLGGLASSIRYCCTGSPHNSDNHEIKHRAFVINGWNCNDEPKLAYQDMKATLNSNYINHMNLTCIRDIESFKGFNYLSKQDRTKALKLDEQFIKKTFPYNQVLIVGHIDGKQHHIHFHNLICVRRFDNGKSIGHNASWLKVAPVMDSVLKDNGYQPLHNGHLHHSSINRAHGTLYHYYHDNSYIIWLSSKIFKAKRTAKTLNEYSSYLKMNGIHTELFKMTKSNTGKRKLKLYSNPTRNGHYKKISNNKFVRYRRHFSYSFNWHGKKIVVRERKLGLVYSKPAIIRKLKQNRQSKKHMVQYIPHFYTHKDPNSNKYNYHKQRESLNTALKEWNYKTKLNNKRLSKLMERANSSDSYSDLFSDIDNDPTFNSPSW